MNITSIFGGSVVTILKLQLLSHSLKSASTYFSLDSRVLILALIIEEWLKVKDAKICTYQLSIEDVCCKIMNAVHIKIYSIMWFDVIGRRT